jgi:Flp pilus assembly protein TadG
MSGRSNRAGGFAGGREMINRAMIRVRRGRLAADRSGSVALWMGLTTPALIMAMAAGIEVGDWAAVKVELQRTADAAALAGAAAYNQTATTHSAATAAAYVAQINGAAGTTTPTWVADTNTLTANRITVQVALHGGIRNAGDTAVRVTVTRPVWLAIGNIFGSNPTVTISASSIAEVVPGVTGGQPCVFSLKGDITLQGNPGVRAYGCTLRSNFGISLGGTASITAPAGTYASGTITGATLISGPYYSGVQKIGDPYASFAPIQNAFASLHSGVGTAVSNQPKDVTPIIPGIYSGWNVKGTLNLAAGLYIVNGDISAGAGALIKGTNVTIISSGVITMDGSSSLLISPPDTSPIAGAIPGILFASNNAGTTTMVGNTASPITGIVYYPNGNLNFRGTSNTGTEGCTELIAASVTLVGTSDLAANCQHLGALSFTSLRGVSAVALVQ